MMTIDVDDLQQDLKHNFAEVKSLFAANENRNDPVVRHLAETVWPFMEVLVEKMTALTEEVQELSEAMHEMIEESGDILQTETAAVFAQVILACSKLAEELGKRLGPSETALRGELEKVKQFCRDAELTLAEVTIPPGEDDDDEDDQADDDQTDDEEEGQDDDASH